MSFVGGPGVTPSFRGFPGQSPEVIRIPVNVEVCLKSDSIARPSDVKDRVKYLFEAKVPVCSEGPYDFSEDDFLGKNVQSIVVCDLEAEAVHITQADLRVYVFTLNEDGATEEQTESEEDVTACNQWVLPAKEYHGLWESLLYEPGIKENLLEYASTAMLFADKRVDSNIISWNRVVLLHGPPGTGKTSLCKGLAQKLAIRLSDRYPNGILLEINAHSLFSKWFSESGKLVMRLFQHIRELVDGEDALVCVLIDEVESLTAARKAALSGSEPSDAVRVVNAVLTQIDALRQMDNVIILTTSNITEAIDLAFVDRADIKQYIGLPTHAARYEILRGAMAELMRVGIIRPTRAIPPFDVAYRHFSGGAAGDAPMAGSGGPKLPMSSAPTHTPISGALRSVASSLAPIPASAPADPFFVPDDATTLLYQASAAAEGLSGRALRKLPFQAHAFFIQSKQCVPEMYAAALGMAVEKELANREAMDHR